MMQTTGNGQIVRKGNGQGIEQANEQQRPKTIAQILSGEGFRKTLAMALPRHITPDRIARVALTALSANPKLAECSQQSFFGSLLSAAQLGLEVNTPLGHAYLVPYKGNAQLIIGYQGELELARRSGQVKTITGDVVRDGDLFEYEMGLEPRLKHVPSDDEKRDDKPVTHVYAMAKLASGEPVFTVLSRAQVEKFRKRSMAANSGPWVTDWDAMAVKTAVRRLWRWLPKSAELVRAIEFEDSAERGEIPAFDAEVSKVLAELPVEATPEASMQPSDTNSPA